MRRLHAAAEEERGLAQKEAMNMEDVTVKVVVEADMLVWIGAMQRGRSSTSFVQFSLD